MNQSIIDYNTYLVSNYESRCNILYYINHINTLQKPIDLTFMSDLLDLVDQDNWIPHTLLIKYGAFKETNASQNVKKSLDLYEMVNESSICIHNIATLKCIICKDKADYRLMNVHESAPNGGCTHRNIYYLKPDTFKFILMRSKCEKKYAKYYILLEKAIKYYHDYQKMFDANVIMHKDVKIDILSKKIDDQTMIMNNQNMIMNNLVITNTNQSLEIQNLLGYARNTNNVVNVLNETVSVLNENVESLTDDVQVNTNIIELAVVDRSLKPDKSDKLGLTCQFVILSNEIEYYVIRRQKRSVKTAINNVKDLYPNIIKTIDCVPNAIYLWTNIKKHTLITSNVEFIETNLFILNDNITESEFLEHIDTIFKEKETKYLPEIRKVK